MYWHGSCMLVMCRAVVSVFFFYLILKLLCPVSVSCNRGEAVSPFIVILVHCMKRVTAVRENTQSKEEREREGGRETDRRKVRCKKDPFPHFLLNAFCTLKWQDFLLLCLCRNLNNKDLSRAFTAAQVCVIKVQPLVNNSISTSFSSRQNPPHCTV